MASKLIILLVIFNSACESIQDVRNNKLDSTEDDSPLKEAAAAILKEKNLENIGGIVSNLLQSGDTKNLLDDVLKNVAGGENGAQLLEGLGSILNAGKKGEDEDDPGQSIDLAKGLETLQTLMGAFQGGGGGGDGDNNPMQMLQGLGSLFSDQKDSEGNLDPELFRQLMNIYTKFNANNKGGKQKKQKKIKEESKKLAPKKPKEDTSFDVNDILSLVTSYMGRSGGAGGQNFNFMSFLSMIMQTFNSFIGPEAEQRAESHSQHSWALPPILEKFHVLLDHFLHSDAAKYLLGAIGDENTFKVFSDENGRFSYAKFEELIENHSFRRHWIQMLTARVVNVLQYVSDPKKQKEYFMAFQALVNSFFKSQGFPKKALFDPKKAGASLTAFVNHASKVYLDVKIESKEYVQPAVKYIQDLLDMTQKSITTKREPKELSEKLADTINMEIIEPITRVNRAYRFLKSQPKCDRYVLCLINQPSATVEESLPGLKKGLYRGSSLIAAWFISSQTGTKFWDYYEDVTGDSNCQVYYSAECEGFHAEEVKVTTEYVHSEL